MQLAMQTFIYWTGLIVVTLVGVLLSAFILTLIISLFYEMYQNKLRGLLNFTNKDYRTAVFMFMKYKHQITIHKDHVEKILSNL